MCAGTLTRNEMTVVRLWVGSGSYQSLQKLCSTARPNSDPLKLNTHVLRILSEGIALNSSASLERSSEAGGDVQGSQDQGRVLTGYFKTA